MLLELSVRNLGVIADLSIVVGPGMTAITGETGAGKTLVIEALELLVGGRADPVLVRPGADEAQVQGRFVAEDAEVVVTRIVPAQGRSRAYLDGALARGCESGGHMRGWWRAARERLPRQTRSPASCARSPNRSSTTLSDSSRCATGDASSAISAANTVRHWGTYSHTRRTHGGAC